MQSLPPFVVEPEPALQSFIWRKSGDHEGQNMANNNRCRTKDTFPPYINVTWVTTRRYAAYKRSCPFK